MLAVLGLGPGTRIAAITAGALTVIGLLTWGGLRVSRRANEMHGQQMGLLDHLRELRYRVLASLGAVGVFAVALFSFDLQPATVAGYRVFKPAPSIADSLASRGVRLILDFSLPEGVDVVVLTPSEPIMAAMQASVIGALVLASPFIAYQVASFIGPALHRSERRTIGLLTPIALVLFLLGVLFALLVMVPLTLRALYNYAGPLGAAPLARPQDIITFVLFSTALFGAAFELPLIMGGLSRAGIVRPSTMGKHWRGVVITILVLGAVLTDPNPLTQMLVALPLVLLYLGGLLVAKLAWKGSSSPTTAAREEPSAGPEG